jgi:putative GTP pyrophosphokinase
MSEGLRERLKYCAESITRLDEEMQMIYEEITADDCEQE